MEVDKLKRAQGAIVMSNITSISNVQSSAPARSTEKLSTASAQQASAKQASLHADKTAISNHSLLISKALSVSDVRTDKVASLQQAISSGSYDVSSSDVAGSLIQALQS